IEALQKKDKEKLCALPVEKLVHGNSEIRNWIVLAGAVPDRDMKVVDYIPCYRSLAGTGCAMGFAFWQ
ncbi:MAG: extradiol ring-cleavage dioxygenase, partial [Gammaproteobacteria bacterium]